MWAWLNPINLIKLLSLVKSLIGYATAFFKLVGVWIAKAKQKKNIDQFKKAEDHIAEANKIEDDTKRLEEKANAASEMEKALDPNHH